MIMVPQFQMGGVRDEFFQGTHGVANVLGQYRARQQQAEQFAAQQELARARMAQQAEQFGATNALARGQFGLQEAAARRQQEEADRIAAQRAKMQSLYQNNPAMAALPAPLRTIGGVTGDPALAQSYFLAEAKRKAAAGGPEDYGKTGYIVTNPDGSYEAIQFGGRGGLKRHQLRGTPTKGTYQVGSEVIDKTTGMPVRNVAPQIAEAKRAQEVGTAGGKAQADLPRIIDTSQQTLDLINKIERNPGTQRNFGVQGMFLNMPGGQAADAWAMIEQLQGKAFLEAFNSLRGGGQITEVEGAKATNAIVRMQTAQSYEAFMAALKDFKSVITMGVERARKQAGLGNPSPKTTTRGDAFPQIRSDADYDALPSGTRFVDPNGQVRTKP
jgi:hypothetical protein